MEKLQLKKYDSIVKCISYLHLRKINFSLKTHRIPVNSIWSQQNFTNSQTSLLFQLFLLSYRDLQYYWQFHAHIFNTISNNE